MLSHVGNKVALSKNKGEMASRAQVASSVASLTIKSRYVNTFVFIDSENKKSWNQ